MSDEDLEAEVTRLRSDLNGVIQQHKRALSRITELEDEVEDLSEELERMRDSEELLQAVRKNGANTTEKRAAVVVNVLSMRASGRDTPRVELDAQGLVDVLHDSIKKPNAYPLMDDIVDIVGRPNVLWKQQESRSAAANTRLVLDLRQGDLPAQIAGEEIEVTSA